MLCAFIDWFPWLCVARGHPGHRHHPAPVTHQKMACGGTGKRGWAVVLALEMGSLVCATLLIWCYRCPSELGSSDGVVGGGGGSLKVLRRRQLCCGLFFDRGITCYMSPYCVTCSCTPFVVVRSWKPGLALNARMFAVCDASQVLLLDLLWWCLEVKLCIYWHMILLCDDVNVQERAKDCGGKIYNDNCVTSLTDEERHC
jgi:hypothetical protein